MNHALLDSLIQGGNGLAEALFSSLLIAFSKSLAQAAQGTSQAGSVSAVTGCTPFSLTRPFQRRKMICHLESLPSFLYRDIRVASEYAILQV